MSEKDRLNLLAVLESINKILQYSQGYSSPDDFYNHQRDFDATMMNFIVIGEMVNRLSTAIIEKNKQIEWFKIKSFRNIVVHDYLGIDAEEVWQIIQNHLPQLKKDLENIVVKLLD